MLYQLQPRLLLSATLAAHVHRAKRREEQRRTSELATASDGTRSHGFEDLKKLLDSEGVTLLMNFFLKGLVNKNCSSTNIGFY